MNLLKMFLPSLVNYAKSYFYFESKKFGPKEASQTLRQLRQLDFTAVFTFCGLSCGDVA